jgi:16S rRNA U1498 N3-methylase RsmE
MAHRPHLHLPGPWQTGTVPLNGQQLSHLRRSLRIMDPSEVTYTDGEGRFGQGVFDGAAVVRGEERMVERPSALIIAVAPPRAKERQRFLVEKLQELGVGTLTWLRTQHGTGGIPPMRRTAAWAISGLEQSRGAWLLHSGGEIGLEDVDNSFVVCDQDGDPVPPPGVSAVAVGPEGGWAPGEVGAGIPRWSLGQTILRVETAAIVAAARLINAHGNA